MSRRNKWKNARDAMMSPFAHTKGVQNRESVPDQCCGKCQRWSENTYASDGRGTCGVLKMGSDLKSDPPAFVLDGDTGLITFFNMDTTACTHFQKMEVIDTDGNECADPLYRRAMRQMEKENQ